MRIVPAFLFISSFFAFSWAFGADSNGKNGYPQFAPCSPLSELMDDPYDEHPHDVGFCSLWNPEYAHIGYRCCSKPKLRGRRRVSYCAPNRRKANHCDELTEDQRLYIQKAQRGDLGDLLTLITDEMGRRGEQPHCTPNSGFLAWGRPVIPTSQNRLRIRVPGRCTEFGTDSMIAMLEWLGRQLATQYSGPEFARTHLLVGDISAPRGGCLTGRSGRRGHASHTTGQDLDLGFLTAKAGKESPSNFSRDFDPVANWWLTRQVFKNPFACIKIIFLDKRLIQKMSKVARGDPEWDRLKRFVRHAKNHRNHFHVRIGEGPGLPGCTSDARPELEDEEFIESSEEPADSSGVPSESEE